MPLSPALDGGGTSEPIRSASPGSGARVQGQERESGVRADQEPKSGVRADQGHESGSEQIKSERESRARLPGSNLSSSIPSLHFCGKNVTGDHVVRLLFPALLGRKHRDKCFYLSTTTLVAAFCAFVNTGTH